MLPVAFIAPQDLLSGAGGLAAAIAIGAFFGPARAIFFSTSEEARRRSTALGGLAGLIAIIGLVLDSIRGR